MKHSRSQEHGLVGQVNYLRSAGNNAHKLGNSIPYDRVRQVGDEAPSNNCLKGAKKETGMNDLTRFFLNRNVLLRNLDVDEI